MENLGVRRPVVGSIAWLDGLRCFISGVPLTIPFPVRDFNVRNIIGIERNVLKTADLADDRTARDSNVLNDAPVAQSDGDNLVVHAGLWLREQELAPLFRQRGHNI